MFNNDNSIMDSLSIPGQINETNNFDISSTLPDAVSIQPRHELHRETSIRKSKNYILIKKNSIKIY